MVNQHKFRVIRRSQRQVVTGIVVNDSLRVPRDDRRKFGARRSSGRAARRDGCPRCTH